ncbi:META domain-containing protein [Shewanella sp.]|uniref:META domain-containing protein n=1 Tax=Shewanella sp. TaxID=50422 RepID=UPI00356831BB
MIKPILCAIGLLSSLCACQTQPQIVTQEQLLGTWNVDVVVDTPAIYNSPANIVFSQNGQLSGNNSCNQFFGHYVQQGSRLQIATQGATMKACIDALMAQEAKLMQAISLVKHVDISDGKLNLMSANGDTLLRLTKHTG